MAEQDEQFDDTDGEVLDPRIREQLKKSRANARAAEEATARAATLERELAFSKAGITSEGMGEYFIKGYDGDITPEAIKDAATKAGILKTEAQNVPDAELDNLRQIQQTATGGAVATSSAAFWNDVRAKAATLDWTKGEAAGRELITLFRDAPAELGFQFGLAE